MTRLQALEQALESLPPVGEAVVFWPKPTANDDGSVEWPRPHYFKSIRDLFDAFENGAFGFAVGDRKYLDCLDAWRRRTGKNPFEPENEELLDREACLLMLRLVNRQERFGDGAWASAHNTGILHAILRRLIALEREGRL